MSLSFHRMPANGVNN